jgi:hypothetical protein
MGTQTSSGHLDFGGSTVKYLASGYAALLPRNPTECALGIRGGLRLCVLVGWMPEKTLCSTEENGRSLSETCIVQN